MLLDLTHLADQAFWEVLDGFGGRVLATHNCCRVLCDHDRQFEDSQIRAIVERSGVIGVALDDWMLSPLWDHQAIDNSGISLETVADHMDHICQVAGNCNHVGIGTDLDGGYGKEQAPCDMDTIAELQHIPEILLKRGYAMRTSPRSCTGTGLRFSEAVGNDALEPGGGGRETRFLGPGGAIDQTGKEKALCRS